MYMCMCMYVCTCTFNPFVGIARLMTESRHEGHHVPWVLPPGISQSQLGGVFKLDWIHKYVTCTVLYCRRCWFQIMHAIFHVWKAYPVGYFLFLCDVQRFVGVLRVHGPQEPMEWQQAGQNQSWWTGTCTCTGVVHVTYLLIYGVPH